MNMKSLKTQFIGAIAMVLVAAIAMGSSTYAWFALNTQVTATGMQVKTVVQNNLLIAEDTLMSTAKKPENQFKTSYAKPVDGLLEPVSTINGVNFFYTDKANVVGSGNTKTDTFVAYALDANQAPLAATTTAFSNNAGLTTESAIGFVDYVYQLKAVNGGDTKHINLKTFNLTYGGNDAKPQEAIRVAIFAQNITDSASFTGGAIAGNLKGIYSVADAQNFSKSEESNANNLAVQTTSALGALVSDYNSVAYTLEAPNGATYYKIIVRLWLEGEDSTCNNETFANLKDKWSLDMMWEMEETATTAKVLTATNNSSGITKANLAGAVTIGDSTVVEGQYYWALTDKTVDSKQIYVYSGTTSTKPAAITKDSHIFTIDATGLYPTDVTNLCILPTT
jgi:hypothetical protein